MCGICKNESRNSLCYKCKKKIQKEFKFTKIHTKDKNFLEQYYLFQYKDLIRNMILEMKFQKKPYIYKTIEYFLQNNKKYLEKLKKYDIIKKEVFLCPIFLQSPSRMNGERLIS